MQNLVVALMEDGHLDAVIVSSCIYVENETSEICVDSIVETVSGCCLWCSGEVDVCQQPFEALERGNNA